MTQPFAWAEIEIYGNKTLETIVATPDDAEIGYMVEVYLDYPD